MARVARGTTVGIGMCKETEMMQVSTRQRQPIALLSLVASSNRACVSSVISAVSATVRVPRIAMPRKQTQRTTLPRNSIQQTLREIGKFKYRIITLLRPVNPICVFNWIIFIKIVFIIEKLINVTQKNGSRHLSSYL